MHTPTMLSLSGKVAIVTGGAGGIGLGIAQSFITQCARVVICDQRQEYIDKALELLGGNAAGIPADVRDEAQCVALTEYAIKEFGRLDILVNNAGTSAPIRATIHQKIHEWQNVMDVNLRGAFLMIQQAGKVMTAQRSGAIINIATVAGFKPMTASNDYGVSKAALIMLTKTVAADFGRFGVRVNAIAPGFTNAPMLYSLLGESRAATSALVSRIPLGRLGSPEDMANAALFLASDMASYITGVTIPVDGGWLTKND